MNAKDQAEGGSGLQEAKDRVTLVVFTSSDGDFEVILLNFSYRIVSFLFCLFLFCFFASLHTKNRIPASDLSQACKNDTFG